MKPKTKVRSTSIEGSPVPSSSVMRTGTLKVPIEDLVVAGGKKEKKKKQNSTGSTEGRVDTPEILDEPAGANHPGVV